MKKQNKGYELTNFCEIDKYAIQSYCAIHGISEDKNLGDITKINQEDVKPFNMICCGSPCQSFSIAGKQDGVMWKCLDCGYEYNPLTVHYSKRSNCPKCGGNNFDSTQSSILVDWLKIIKNNKPIWGIYENVKNILSKNFKDTFQIFLDELNEYGYNTYFDVLNAKDYGVPQNRERVYLIFILKNFDNGKFKFPDSFDAGIRLEDILENDVDEKYYVKNEKTERLINELIKNGKLV